MKIKKLMKKNLGLRICLYLLVGVIAGLIMVNNEMLLGLGIILLFLSALNIDIFKKKK